MHGFEFPGVTNRDHDSERRAYACYSDGETQLQECGIHKCTYSADTHCRCTQFIAHHDLLWEKRGTVLRFYHVNFIRSVQNQLIPVDWSYPVRLLHFSVTGTRIQSSRNKFYHYMCHLYRSAIAPIPSCLIWHFNTLHSEGVEYCISRMRPLSCTYTMGYSVEILTEFERKMGIPASDREWGIIWTVVYIQAQRRTTILIVEEVSAYLILRVARRLTYWI